MRMTRSQRPSQDHILRDRLKQPQSQAHRPRDEHVLRDTKIPKPIGHEMSIFLETVPQKQNQDSGTSPESEMSILLETAQKIKQTKISKLLELSEFWYFCFFGTVSKNERISGLWA